VTPFANHVSALRGRPPKLDGKLAAEIAGLLIAGSSTTDSAQTLGLTRRSIPGWRSRAWSRDLRDVDCVALEQMIQRGRLAAADVGQREVGAHP
jgi:hypothetical protein